MYYLLQQYEIQSDTLNYGIRRARPDEQLNLAGCESVVLEQAAMDALFTRLKKYHKQPRARKARKIRGAR